MKRNSFKLGRTQNKIILIHDQNPHESSIRIEEGSSNTQGKRFMRKSNVSIERKTNRSNCTSNESLATLHNISAKTNPTSTTIHTISPSYVRISSFLKHPSTPKQHKSAVEINGNIQPFNTEYKKNSNNDHLNKGFRISEEKDSSKNSRVSEQSAKSHYFLNNKMRNNIAILKTQLQLKQKDALELQEKLKVSRNIIQQLKKKETKISEEYLLYRKSTQKMQQSLKSQIETLTLRLDEQKKTIGQLKKNNKDTNQQLKIRKIDIQCLKKELNILLHKKIPKNVIQLQSWREMSLQQQLKQHKKHLGKNKTLVQEELEEITTALREENLELRHYINSLQLIQRVMIKKTEGSSKYLDAYIGMKSQYHNARLAIKSLNEECQCLRRQNTKLKKQIKCNKSQKSIQKISDALLEISSVESLNISINSRD